MSFFFECGIKSVSMSEKRDSICVFRFFRVLFCVFRGNLFFQRQNTRNWNGNEGTENRFSVVKFFSNVSQIRILTIYATSFKMSKAARLVRHVVLWKSDQNSLHNWNVKTESWKRNNPFSVLTFQLSVIPNGQRVAPMCPIWHTSSNGVTAINATI